MDTASRSCRRSPMPPRRPVNKRAQKSSLASTRSVHVRTRRGHHHVSHHLSVGHDRRAAFTQRAVDVRAHGAEEPQLRRRRRRRVLLFTKNPRRLETLCAFFSKAESCLALQTTIVTCSSVPSSGQNCIFCDASLLSPKIRYLETGDNVMAFPKFNGKNYQRPTFISNLK